MTETFGLRERKRGETMSLRSLFLCVGVFVCVATVPRGAYAGTCAANLNLDSYSPNPDDNHMLPPFTLTAHVTVGGGAVQAPCTCTGPFCVTSTACQITIRRIRYELACLNQNTGLVVPCNEQSGVVSFVGNVGREVTQADGSP